MPYAAWIPMPVIAAILFMVAYNMSEWRQFLRICRTAPASDVLVLILTFGLTVIFDLVVAIEVGMILAAVLFMKRMTDVTNLRVWKDADKNDPKRLKPLPENIEVVELDGPMFFATSEKFAAIELKKGVNILILRMRTVPSLDISALRSLEVIHRLCMEKEIRLILSHVNEQPLAVMKKAGFYDKVGEENFADNIDLAIEIASK